MPPCRFQGQSHPAARSASERPVAEAGGRGARRSSSGRHARPPPTSRRGDRPHHPGYRPTKARSHPRCDGQYRQASAIRIEPTPRRGSPRRTSRGAARTRATLRCRSPRRPSRLAARQHGRRPSRSTPRLRRPARTAASASSRQRRQPARDLGGSDVCDHLVGLSGRHVRCHAVSHDDQVTRGQKSGRHRARGNDGPTTECGSSVLDRRLLWARQGPTSKARLRAIGQEAVENLSERHRDGGLRRERPAPDVARPCPTSRGRG